MRLVVASVFLIVVTPIVQAPQQGIDCAVPPGGRIECESRQAAFCRIDGGRVQGYCRTPPPAPTAEFAQWVRERLGVDVMELRSEAGLLKGSGEIRRGPLVVTFRFPPDK